METARWDEVELRDLRVLAAVAEAGSFTAAARRLAYAQSALSARVAALERAVGAQLLVRPRGPGRVAPTPAGAALLAHARALEERLLVARADVRAAAGGDAATLRLGLFPSIGARVLPGVVRTLAARSAPVPLELVELNDDTALLDAVEAGTLDATFAVYPLRAGPFAVRPLLREPYALLVPAAWPIADGAGPPAPAAIAALPLVGYRTIGAAHRPEVLLAALGVEPNVVLRSDDPGTAIGLVDEGLAAAIVPRLLAAHLPAGVRALDLSEVLPPRTTAIAWHAERREAAALLALADAAEAVCAALPR